MGASSKPGKEIIIPRRGQTLVHSFSKGSLAIVWSLIALHKLISGQHPSWYLKAKKTNLCCTVDIYGY